MKDGSQNTSSSTEDAGLEASGTVLLTLFEELDLPMLRRTQSVIRSLLGLRTESEMRAALSSWDMAILKLLDASTPTQEPQC